MANEKLYCRLLSLLLILLLLAIAVATAFLLIRGFDASVFNSGEQENSGGAAAPSQGDVGDGVTLGKTPDYGSFYSDSIIYLGDSTIAKMAELGILSGGTDTKQIWTDPSQLFPLDFNSHSTAIIFPETGKEMSAGEAAAEKKPPYLIIAVGINNGVPYCSEAKFKQYYSKLIGSITESSPETRIILQSILPVSKAYEKSSAAVTQDRIDTANSWIREICLEHSLRYLDTASALKGDGGYLASEYDGGDGLHLNTEGYRKLVEYVRTHGYK